MPRGGWRARYANWTLRRRLRKVQEYRLADLPEDTIARIKGTVRPIGDRLLTAPLSGRPCVYYSAVVLLNTHLINLQGEDSPPFEKVLAKEQSVVPFLLEDGAQRAFIDARGAEMFCAYDHRTESKALFDATAVQHAILARNRSLDLDWWNVKSIEYVEGVIAPGEPIVVLGGGTSEPDPDAQGSGGYRESSRTRFRFASTKRFQLVVSDDPKAQ